MPRSLTTRIIAAVLLAYMLGFALFPPRVLVIVDESQYVSQAVAFTKGSRSVPGYEIVGATEALGVLSNYPVGTSLLQTPFVAVGGWRFAALASVLSLLAATLATMALLRSVGLGEGFAVLVPAYFGSLFFGRVAMSDMPSCAIVACSLWLLRRAENGRVRDAFLAGLAGGLSLLFREPNAVVLAPFYVGALARRRASVASLVAGGALGLAARFVSSSALFGSPWYLRDSGYGFSLASLAHNLPPYAVILGVLFPLGLLLPFVYRGRWRAEVITAAALYIAMFLTYDWDSVRQNGPLKALILNTRYMLPLIPVLTLMAAEVLPRWYARLPALHRWGRPLALAAGGGLAVAAFGIHALARREEGEHVAIMHAFQSATAADAAVVTNHDATLKYFSPAYGPRRLWLRDRTDVARLPELRQRGRVLLAFLDRTDSELFRADATANAAYVAAAMQRCRLAPIRDEAHGSALRLRVLDVTHCD